MQNGTVLKRLFEKGFFYRRLETEDSGFCTTFWSSGTNDRTSNHTGIYHL